MSLGNKMKLQIIREFENFHLHFLNWDISIENKAKHMKIGEHVVRTYLEGTVSQMFYLDHSFYFMKSRKLS